MESVNQVISDRELIARFKDDCFIRGLSNHTVEGYISSLNLLSSFLKDKGYSILTVDRKVLREYIAFLRESNISDKTIQNRVSAFSSLYDYAVYENLINRNVVLDIRRRYLRSYKLNDSDGGRRKIISVKDMAMFLDSIIDIRDKTIALLLAKTGIRRTELINIDVDDIDWDMMSITRKKTHKRSNRVVFFDFETSRVLKQWLDRRSACARDGCNALFVSYTTGKRVDRNGVYNSFINWAIKSGLHNPKSKKVCGRFTPHCCRHWFTTHLRRAGMSREFIMELRGDKLHDAMDVYYHIDKEELRKSYLACIPQLGV
jgi:integrase/recombinase XerD